MKKIIASLSVFTIGIILVIVAAIFLYHQISQSIYINTHQTAVVEKMRSLSRLETASFTIEKIIDAGTTGNPLNQFFFGDKILLIAHGEVIAGFDLSSISKQDVTIAGKNLTVHLPVPEILSTSLDESQTRVYDRTTGLFSKGNKDLESQARVAAVNSIRQAACSEGILDQATNNARKQLTALFSDLAFSSVTIDIPSGNCQ